jgi:sirohydrochlorin ferrochelatase
VSALVLNPRSRPTTGQPGSIGVRNRRRSRDVLDDLKELDVSTNSGISAVGRKTSPMLVNRITTPSEANPTEDNDGVGIIVVDHGSRSADANLRHECFVASWHEQSRYKMVAPAHLEFAEPSISSAFDSCVSAGATNIVIVPLFLWPGIHLERDIPVLVGQSASRYPGVAYAVGPPLGAHPLLFEIVDDHTAECLDRLPST